MPMDATFQPTLFYLWQKKLFEQHGGSSIEQHSGTVTVYRAADFQERAFFSPVLISVGNERARDQTVRAVEARGLSPSGGEPAPSS